MTTNMTTFISAADIRLQQFLHWYIKLDYNATRAYLKVHTNACRETAGVEACKTLKKPKAIKFLNKHYRDIAVANALTEQSLAARLSGLADKAEDKGQISVASSNVKHLHTAVREDKHRGKGNTESYAQYLKDCNVIINK